MLSHEQVAASGRLACSRSESAVKLGVSFIDRNRGLRGGTAWDEENLFRRRDEPHQSGISNGDRWEFGLVGLRQQPSGREVKFFRLREQKSPARRWRDAGCRASQKWGPR